MPFSSAIAPTPSLRRQREPRDEAVQAAGVPDVALVAAPHPVEAEPLRLGPVVVRDDPRPQHLVARRAREHLLVLVPEPERAPAREVVDARPEAAVGLEQARRIDVAPAAGGRRGARSSPPRARPARRRTRCARARAAPAGAPRRSPRTPAPRAARRRRRAAGTRCCSTSSACRAESRSRTFGRSRTRSAIEPNGSDSGSSVGCSPCMPLVCISRRRSVTSSTGPNGFVIAAASGTWTTTGSSSRRRPASRSCRIADAVNVFEIDATRYCVCASGRRPVSRSANP